jgi:hypothetical protein
MNRPVLKASIGFVVAMLLVAACGGSSSTSVPAAGQSAPPDQTDAGSSSAPAGGAAAGAGGGDVSTLNLRIANFISQVGTAGPALDIYGDALNPPTPGGAAPQPLFSNVAFGTVSAYFHPHVPADGGYIHLYALKTGQDPVNDKADAGSFFVGTNDNAQATIVLTYDGQGPLSSAPPLSAIGSISFSSFLEKGGGTSFGGDTAPLAPPPPAGDGMFLAADHDIPGNLSGTNFLMIDDSCAPPLNGLTNEPGLPRIFNSSSATVQSAFALFPASAGSHQVSVVSNDTSTLPTCQGLTPKQGTTTVQLTAGEEALTFVYGTSATDLHLAIAPIAP